MISPEKPVLNGPRVTLRDTQTSDVQARFELGNSPEIQAMFGADPAQVRPITQDAAEAWVNSVKQEPNAWVITLGKVLLGSIRLHSVNPIDRRANIAVGLLNTDDLGRGLGTEAIKVLAAHAFENKGLHRLSCRVLANNPRAIAAYKKVGFVEEGRERESAHIGQEWHDDLIMGLLQRDLVPLT